MSLPEDFLSLLLKGRCPPHYHAGEIFWTKEKPEDCIGKTIDSLALLPRSANVPNTFILHVPCHNEAEMSQPFQRWQEPDNIKHVQVCHRQTPVWKPCPLPASEPKVIQYEKKYTACNADSVHYFLVTKTQGLDFYEGEKEYGVHCVSRKGDSVHLFMNDFTASGGDGAQSKISQVSSGIFRVCNVHPEFDGYHVGQSIPKNGALAIPFKQRIFDVKKTPVEFGRISLVASVNTRPTLFEISSLADDHADSEEASKTQTCFSETESEDEEAHSIESGTESMEPEEEIEQIIPPFGLIPQQPIPTPQPKYCTVPMKTPVQQAPATPWTPAWAPRLVDCQSSIAHSTQPLKFTSKTACKSASPAWLQSLQQEGARNPFKVKKLIEELKMMDDSSTRVHLFQILTRKFDLPALINATNDKIFSTIKGGTSLRSYQQEAVNIVMQPGNYLLYAATGSGKTLIFIEVARHVLAQNIGALVVVVVPKIALTDQHAIDFRAHLANEGRNVCTFCSETSKKSILEKFSGCDVAIVTADWLAGRLQQQMLKFSMIDLLILDEAHETKGNNPYHRVMSMYGKYLEERPLNPTKVFGVTATPTHGKKKYEQQINLANLLELLRVPSNHYVTISDTNTVIVGTIPQAKPETIVVESRVKDSQFRKLVVEFLQDLFSSTLWQHFAKWALSELNTIRKPQCYTLLDDGEHKSLFQEWAGRIHSTLDDCTVSKLCREDIKKSISMICSMEEAVLQSREFGFEAALHDLIQKLKIAESHLSCMIADEPVDEYNDDFLFYKFFLKFRQSSFGHILQGSANLAALVLPSDYGSFPKFSKLVELLDEYRDRDDFHAIVFIRTRVGCHQLCKQLQNTMLGRDFNFEKIVGQKKAISSQRLITDAEKGMNLREQSKILEWFRKDGRKVLVSTSVCEEGINVKSCELVIRYSVALTSTEYTQSAGRARKLGARFVNIVEEDSKERLILQQTEASVCLSKETIMCHPNAIQIT